MGSEIFVALKSQGSTIRRGGGEIMEGPPEDFIIVGRDITAEKLSALYPDDSAAHERARRIIAGVRDRTRAEEDPPAYFVATMRHGQEEPAKVANLGPDKRGKIRIVVVAGRKRNLALRIWNREHPEQRWDYFGLLAPLKHNTKAGIDAELDALMSNAVSNVFVGMPPSGMADHAAMLAAKRKSPADIATSIGARDAGHVLMLLDLAACAPEVQAAVDAGNVPLAACVDLRKHPPEEQARRVARKAARGPTAKNGAAPARAKTLNANVLLRVRGEIGDDERTAIDQAIAATLALACGDFTTALANPHVRPLVLRAGYDEAKGRMPSGGQRKPRATT